MMKLKFLMGITTATGIARGALFRKDRDQAEELEGGLARVGETVQFVGRYIGERAGLQRVFFLFVQHRAVPFEYVHFMLEIMCMSWRMSARRDFKLTHGEVGRTVSIVDEDSDCASDRSFHVDRRGSDFAKMVDFHENSFWGTFEILLCSK
jgi:hypothetical protein